MIKLNAYVKFAKNKQQTVVVIVKRRFIVRRFIKKKIGKLIEKFAED